MRCWAETLAATDEASPRTLAMTKGERKQGWEEADGEGLRDAVPPAPLLIKGWGQGSAIKMTAGEAIDRPPRPIKGALVSTHARTSSHIPHACHPSCAVHAAYVAQEASVVGRVEQRFQSRKRK